MKIVKPKYWLLILLFALLTLYALYQARFLILGPQILIESHEDGESVESPVLILGGRTQNISWLSLNGRQIFTDEEGYWSEKLIVSTGTSIITLKARDRFGREKGKEIRIVLK